MSDDNLKSTPRVDINTIKYRPRFTARLCLPESAIIVCIKHLYREITNCRAAKISRTYKFLRFARCLI